MKKLRPLPTLVVGPSAAPRASRKPSGNGFDRVAANVTPPSLEGTNWVERVKPVWMTSPSRVPSEPKYIPNPPRITVFGVGL